jgi:hypothetical protein
VRRRGLTPDQKTQLALYDNRAAELAEWDDDALKALEAQGADLGDLFTAGELESLHARAEDERAAPEPLGVDRPLEVAWVLLAIPVADWPKQQAAVEALQVASKFSTMVLRPKVRVK